MAAAVQTVTLRLPARSRQRRDPADAGQREQFGGEHLRETADLALQGVDLTRELPAAPRELEGDAPLDPCGQRLERLTQAPEPAGAVQRLRRHL